MFIQKHNNTFCVECQEGELKLGVAISPASSTICVMEMQELVRARMKRKREEKNFTQEAVAEKEGKVQSYISNLENRPTIPPTWPLLARLAVYYETSTDYLLGLTDDDRPTSEVIRAKVERGITERLAESRTPYLTDEQAILLELYESLDEGERAYVLGLIEFVRKRNTPRIIGEE